MANVKDNPRQTYRALLLDYDALLLASDDECSYCLSEREVQMMLAFVDYIGWKTRYIATETEIDTNLIKVWSANLGRKLMAGCCGDNGTQHRVTESGIWQTSQDDGVTWYDDPTADPRNNASYFAPLAGDDGPEKACEGATNAFEFFKQALIDELATGLAYSEIFSAIIGVLGVLGILGVGIIAAVITAAIFVAGVTVVQAAFTSAVWSDFKCILYCNISPDASYTDAQWQQVKSEVNSKFTGVVQVILWNWVNALGKIGLTNAARSNMGLGADCSTCDCDGCLVSVTFDSVDDAPYTIINGTLAAAVHGVALWGEVIAGDIYQAKIRVDTDTTCTYTGFTTKFLATNGRPTQDVGLEVSYFDIDDNLLRNHGNPSTPGVADGVEHDFNDLSISLTGVAYITVLLNWGGWSTYGGSGWIDDILLTA